MVGKIDFKRILFLDIETVSTKKSFEDLSEVEQMLWQKKSRFIIKQYEDDKTEAEKISQSYNDRAAIFAEFGKIVCITVGIVTGHSGEWQLRIKSFADTDEKKLLEDFADLLHQYYNNPQTQGLCGHNIKEFDVPYICRRMIVNGLNLPEMIDIGGKKPWETKHLIDTLEMWKFGDIKHYTSLELLANLLGIPTPKDDIDGAMVGKVFWEDDDLDRIIKYCEKDVVTVTNLFFRLNNEPLIPDHDINFIK